jgi:hypothetical protein
MRLTIRHSVSLAIFVLILSFGCSSFAEGLSLSYGFVDGDRAVYELEVEQELGVSLADGDSKSVSSVVRADVGCVLEKKKKDATFFLGITFSGLNGEFAANGKSVEGIDLSQVGELRMSAHLNPRGEVLKKFVAPINSQIDGTMRLIQDTLFNVLPVLAESEVSVGDSWVHVSEQGSRNSGGQLQLKLSRRFTLERVDDVDGRRLALIKVTHEVVMTNAVQGAETVSKVKGRGQGSGTLVFDANAGKLVSGNVEIEFKSDSETGNAQKSLLKIKLSSPKP